MARRYFVENLSNKDKDVIILNDDAHHISTVLRAKCGDTIILCDANGYDYNATIKDIQKKQISLEINTFEKSVSEPTVEVNIYIGYPKQDKLEQVIQKATELGAISITPFFSKNCVVTQKNNGNDEKKTNRLQKIARQAAQQSGRGVIPSINKPLTFDEMLKEATKNDLALLFYEADESNITLHSRLSGNKKTIAVITGSEGGFSLQEVQKAQQNGCFSVGLGPRILRCETAPIAALSAIMALTGNLQ